jgi:hypothetical protein
MGGSTEQTQPREKGSVKQHPRRLEGTGQAQGAARERHNYGRRWRAEHPSGYRLQAAGRSAQAERHVVTGLSRQHRAGNAGGKATAGSTQQVQSY